MTDTDTDTHTTTTGTTNEPSSEPSSETTGALNADTGTVDTTTSTTGTTGPTGTSLILAALERAWVDIKSRHRDLPDVVIVMASGTIGMRPGTVRLGHFAVERWTVGSPSTGRMPEMFVAGEGLQRGAVEVLGTLLHEGAHGIAAVRGIQDTSRQGRWHNSRFKTIGEELGLTITRSSSLPIGWSDTAVAAETQAEYAPTLRDLDAAITMWRRAEIDVTVSGPTPGAGQGTGEDGEDGDAGREPTAAKPRGTISALCACATPRRIRVAVSALARGPITCASCGQPFIALTS